MSLKFSTFFPIKRALRDRSLFRDCGGWLSFLSTLVDLYCCFVEHSHSVAVPEPVLYYLQKFVFNPSKFAHIDSFDLPTFLL
jgi:hypothetical protein